MKTPSPFVPAQKAGKNSLKLIIATGLLALLPLIIFRKQIGELFWFGDDWDQLDQIQRLGFWNWIWQVVGENFAPFSKSLWGGSVFLFRGSYFGMIFILWLTHAVNTIQLGRLLQLYEFPVGSILASQIVFGLTPCNIETLGWATQWPAVLATSFLLFAFEWILRVRPFIPTCVSKKTERIPAAIIVSLSTASALSFSRGVLTGLFTGSACFWPTENKTPFFRRCIFATIFLLPAIIATGMIMRFSSGNHQHLVGHLSDAADYGLWYFCMNPFYLLLEMDSWGTRTIVLLGTIKIAAIAWSLFRSETPQRRLLIFLVLFDVGNAALTGVGRYHTGLSTTISSRYQYNSLLATLPFAALCFDHMWSRLAFVKRRPTFAYTAFLLVLALWFCHRWKEEVSGFCGSRGSETRELLFHNSAPPENGAIPGIPYFTTKRAKELVDTYNLH